MSRRSIERSVFIACLWFSSAGCSIAFNVKGPPSGHQDMESFTCTGSKIAPNIDGVGMALSGLILLSEAVAGGIEEDPKGFGVLGTALVALGVSSSIGHRRVSAC